MGAGGSSEWAIHIGEDTDPAESSGLFDQGAHAEALASTSTELWSLCSIYSGGSCGAVAKQTTTTSSSSAVAHDVDDGCTVDADTGDRVGGL